MEVYQTGGFRAKWVRPPRPSLALRDGKALSLLNALHPASPIRRRTWALAYSWACARAAENRCWSAGSPGQGDSARRRRLSRPGRHGGVPQGVVRRAAVRLPLRADQRPPALPGAGRARAGAAAIRRVQVRAAARRGAEPEGRVLRRGEGKLVGPVGAGWPRSEGRGQPLCAHLSACPPSPWRAEVFS